MNRNKQNEGMRYPSIDQLIAKSPSKYKLRLRAERAKEIERTKKTYLERRKTKKASVSLEEIYHDKVVIKSRTKMKKH